jgi:uncharacterized protein
MRDFVAPLICGGLFGFALGWAHLYNPGVIHDMLRFREAYVYLIMVSAIATAFIGIRVLQSFGVKSVFAGTPVSWQTAPPTRDHWLGGALFGVGWGLSCACPGPIAILVARGEIPGMILAAGVLIGIARRDAMIARAPAAAGTPAPTATEPI